MRMIVTAIFLSLAALPAYAPAGLILAENYGVVADYDSVTGTGTNNLAAINAVNAACRNLNPIAKGCAVQWPTGPIMLNGTPNEHDYAPKWSGTGAGAIQALPGGQVDGSGTTFVQLCGTCTTFRFTSLDGPTLRDFGIKMPLDATDGTAIYIRPSANPQNYQATIHPVIQNIRTIGGWNVVTCELCTESAFVDTVMWSFRMHGYVMFNSASFSDNGDNSIRGAKFWFLMPFNNNLPGGSCIRLSTSAAVEITGFKMLSCSTGVNIVATQGRTGTAIISGGSIEEVKINSIRVEQGAPDAQGKCYGYGNIILHHVQIANGSYPTYTGGVVFSQGVCGQHYIDYAKIDHLMINLGYTAPVNIPPFFFTDVDPHTVPARAPCISIMDGYDVEVDHVSCNGNNGVNYGGIKVGGFATKVALEDNHVTFPGPGLPTYEILVPGTYVRDMRSGLSVASLGPYVSNYAPGSTFYLVDGHSTSWPANPSTSPGGVGCIATVNSASGGYVVCAQP